MKIFFISVKRYEPLPGPVSAGDGRLLHLQPQRFTPRLHAAQISSITEAAEEAGPCIKGAFKKCHCCVLEVRENKLTMRVLARLAAHFLDLLSCEWLK